MSQKIVSTRRPTIIKEPCIYIGRKHLSFLIREESLVPFAVVLRTALDDVKIGVLSYHQEDTASGYRVVGVWVFPNEFNRLETTVNEVLNGEWAL